MLDQKIIRQQTDSFSNGGKADAFRHVFYMASYSQKIKSKTIRKLGIAHEKYNYRQFLRSGMEYGERPDSLSSVMDLKNNELGIQLGNQHHAVGPEDLQQLVMKEIKMGKAFIMKRNANGNYLSCEGTIVEPGIFKKQWYVPKCLVPSNSIYNN